MILIERLNCHNTSTGIRIAFSSDIRVVDSDISDNKVDGITIYKSFDIEILNNQIDSNENSGISLGGNINKYTTNITIKDNNVTSNGHGIFFHSDCNNNVIKHNLISNNIIYGIGFNWDCNKNEIINNSINNNGYVGIDLESLCDSNLISNNFCFNNTIGIKLHSSDSCIVNNNTLYNNKYGISSYDNENNIYESNTIFNNVNGIYFQDFNRYTKSNTNIMKFNMIYDNQDYGVVINKSYVDITASLNYWGDNSGPYHPINNSNGMGDNISDRVIFNPWLTLDGEQISLKEDSDNDGILDIDDPDDDNDGMPDVYELNYYFLDPLNSSDANEDYDGDGYSNYEEYEYGTDPDRDPGDPPQIENSEDGNNDNYIKSRSNDFLFILTIVIVMVIIFLLLFIRIKYFKNIFLIGKDKE